MFVNDYKKLEKQPLQFVLAEFRFSPVMQIAEYIPKLQEAYRKQYPIIKSKSEQAFQVGSNGLKVSTIEHWSFVTSDNKAAIEVNQERLIYCTTTYNRFDGFKSACKNALTILSEIVEPGLILQVGLRYSDLVKVDENENISTLVDPHLAFPKKISDLGDGIHQRSETFIKTDLGILAIRTLYGKHNLSCLPDIQGLPIFVEKDDMPSERIILDFDNFWKVEANEEAVSFDVTNIIDKLNSMHDNSRRAFWDITTDHARKTKWS